MSWKTIGMHPTDYANEMHKALDSGLYISALVIALMIPDVCATAADENDRTDGKRYKAWTNEYLIPILREQMCAGLSADDIYQLRNALLHNGSLAPDAGKLTKYHNVRFHLVAPSEPLQLSSGSIEVLDEQGEANRELHLTINLARYIQCVGTAVSAFLAAKPNADIEISKGRLGYGGMADFTAEIKLQ